MILIRDHVLGLLGAALDKAGYGQYSAALVISQPKNPRHGDVASPIAFEIAKDVGKRPRDVAQAIASEVPDDDPVVEAAEVGGAGYINFRLRAEWLQQNLERCLQEGTRYGCNDSGGGKRVQVEFVSANPVGPIHIGNARGGPYGDVLASLLTATGYKVEREFYVNDGPHNTQAQTFGASLQARYREQLGLPFEFPEDGYQGEYVVEMARQLVERDGDKHAGVPQDEEGARHFFQLVLPEIVATMKDDCQALGIKFDRWFYESELYKEGEVEAEVKHLLDTGAAYEKEGAVWLKTQEHGDDQDRVLIRADGRPTYIASDLAYARNKFKRGFEHTIYVLGPDHAGYIPRMRAAFAAIGIDPNSLEILMYQNVRLIEGGEVLSLSKRKGTMVTMREIVDDVGKDAARFFFLMRNESAHLDFDLDLARSQSEENPVYYVQYAHTRICGIQREAERQGFEVAAEADLSLLTAPEERALLLAIALYPDDVDLAASTRSPHELTYLSRELAQTFHQFYTVCRVLDTDNPELSAARLKLVAGTRIVLANILGLLGVSAPERM